MTLLEVKYRNTDVSGGVRTPPLIQIMDKYVGTREYVEMLTGKTAPKCWPMLIHCPPSAHGSYMNSWEVPQNCSKMAPNCPSY